jgi:hypothetical protein
MFHYHYHKLGRQSYDIQVGDHVQSRYRAPWRGEVVDLNPQTGAATVQQTTDRHGNPFRKPRRVIYHCRWFRLLHRPR